MTAAAATPNVMINTPRVLAKMLGWGLFTLLCFWGGTVIGATINGLLAAASAAGFFVALTGRLIPLAIAEFRFLKAMKTADLPQRGAGIAIAATMVGVDGLLWFMQSHISK